MEILVKKLDNGMIEVKDEIFDIPFCIDSSKLFEALFREVRDNLYVMDVKYVDSKLSLEKYDFFHSCTTTDNYTFDDELVNDSKFMSSINELLSLFDGIKDDLRAFIYKEAELWKKRKVIDNQAKCILREYCLTGSITLPEDRTNLDKVYNLLKCSAMLLFSYYAYDENGEEQRYNTVELSELGIDGIETDSDEGYAILSEKSKEAAAILKEKCSRDDGVKVFTKNTNVSGQTSN